MRLDDVLSSIDIMLSDEARAELFRHRRVRLLNSGNSPIALLAGHRLFVHVVPQGRKQEFKKLLNKNETASPVNYMIRSVISYLLLR